MKRILVFLGVLFLISTVNAKGSVDLSNNSIAIEVGNTAKFVISADNAAGLIDIKSTDESIITVDKNSFFFDSMLEGNDKVTVKITAIKEGIAKVNVIITDVTTYDEETLSGTKEIEVTVNNGSSPTPTDESVETSTPEPTIEPTDNPTPTNEPSSNSKKTSSYRIYYIIGIVVLLIIIGLILRSLLKKKKYY